MTDLFSSILENFQSSPAGQFFAGNNSQPFLYDDTGRYNIFGGATGTYGGILAGAAAAAGGLTSGGLNLGGFNFDIPGVNLSPSLSIGDLFPQFQGITADLSAPFTFNTSLTPEFRLDLQPLAGPLALGAVVIAAALVLRGKK